MSFDDSRLIEYSNYFDSRFEKMLPVLEGASSRLTDAMKYSAMAGGKRIRPYLVMRFCELCGSYRDNAIDVAAAIECIHTYSLIHDDLPALDNDDLRRGKPTSHKQFDESTAILAGDALLTFAFELVANASLDSVAVVEIVKILAVRAGYAGMVGGQMADILHEKNEPNADLMHYIHRHKTADLITASVICGAVCAGARSEQIEMAERFGINFGMAFQVTDDICDATCTAEEMGKAVGKDIGAGKQNAVAVYGIEGAKKIAERYVKTAVASLSIFKGSEDLKQLVQWLPERRK